MADAARRGRAGRLSLELAAASPAALPRSERAVELLQWLEPALLQDKGRRLREILRLVMAVDSEPLAKVIARTQPNLTLPQGVDAIVIPKGTSWAWLVIWSGSTTSPAVNMPAAIQYSGFGWNTRLELGCADTANTGASDIPMPTAKMSGGTAADDRT